MTVFELRPRGELERAILRDPEVQVDLTYGEPRWGHPEGSVGAHVAELWTIVQGVADVLTPGMVEDLRVLALLHDLGKRKPWPAGTPHHGVASRRIAARFIGDQRLLDIVAEHDEPYRLWKRERRTGESVWDRLVVVFDRVRADFDLFVIFFTVDGSSGDKDPAPRLWLQEMARCYAPDDMAWEAPARAIMTRRLDGPIGPHRDT